VSREGRANVDLVFVRFKKLASVALVAAPLLLAGTAGATTLSHKKMNHHSVKVLEPTLRLEKQLHRLFVLYRAKPTHPKGYAPIATAAITGIATQVHVAKTFPNATEWAMALFVPKTALTTQTFIGFQDGGNKAIFKKSEGKPWKVIYVGPCSGPLPLKVSAAWGVGRSLYPGCDKSATNK